MKQVKFPKINQMKRDKLQNYQNSSKRMQEYRAYLNWQENIEKEKKWKNFSNEKSLDKQKVEPLHPGLYNNPKPYQPRDYNREDERKFREINKKNLKNYNKKLAKQQKEELSKLSKFYQKAIKINKIKLPIIPNRLNIRPKPDYAEGHKYEYDKALLFVDKKLSKENLEDFNDDIENVENINYNIKNVEDFNSYIRIKNANEKYLKQFQLNNKKLFAKLYTKHNRPVKKAKQLLSTFAKRDDINDYLNNMLK